MNEPRRSSRTLLLTAAAVAALVLSGVLVGIGAARLARTSGADDRTRAAELERSLLDVTRTHFQGAQRANASLHGGASGSSARRRGYPTAARCGVPPKKGFFGWRCTLRRRGMAPERLRVNLAETDCWSAARAEILSVEAGGCLEATDDTRGH